MRVERRAVCSKCLRPHLDHAGVVRIIEPLEETRKEFLLVTEEVLGSLDSWLNGHCKFQQEVFSSLIC